MNEAELESCAEAELRAALIELLQVATEGKVLDGAIVASVHSGFNLCEDGQTQMALIDLADGNVVAISVCPGEPIHIAIVT